MTRDELLALPGVVGIPTASQALGIAANTGYLKAKDGTFPCPVLRIGRLYKVPRAGLLAVLGIAEPEPGRPSATPPALRLLDDAS